MLGENLVEVLWRLFYTFCATVSSLHRIFVERPAIAATPELQLLTISTQHTTIIKPLLILCVYTVSKKPDRHD